MMRDDDTHTDNTQVIMHQIEDSLVPTHDDGLNLPTVGQAAGSSQAAGHPAAITVDDDGDAVGDDDDAAVGGAPSANDRQDQEDGAVGLLFDQQCMSSRPRSKGDDKISCLDAQAHMQELAGRAGFYDNDTTMDAYA